MIQYKFEDESFLKENEHRKLCDDSSIIDQDDIGKLIVLYYNLINSIKKEDINNYLTLINEIIINNNDSISFGFPIQEILNYSFQIFENNDESVKVKCFETMITILQNFYFQNESKIGNYYHENNFHQILHFIYSSNNEDYHPNIILYIVKIYSSTCIEARDSIIGLFGFQFFQQFIQTRNSECLKHVISCFTEFFKYPLDVHTLSSLFCLLYEMSTTEDDEIIIEILNCLKKSMNQKDWEIFFIENKLHRFVHHTLAIDNNNSKELSIEILNAYSVGFPIRVKILETIINEFLKEEISVSEKYSILTVEIFTNHMHRDYEREILLKQGMIFVLLNFFENGTFSIKVAVLRTIIEMTKFGNLDQKKLVFEYNMMDMFFSVIQSNDIQITIDILDTLLILLSITGNDNLDQTFMKQLNECDGLNYISELSYHENNEIHSKALLVLDKINDIISLDDKNT